MNGLADADRRLAHEIAAGVLRHRTRLDDAIAPRVRAPWERVQPDLQDILRMGGYQLLHLRVPDYAAVESAVALAKMELGAKPAGLVNAVLRRVAEEGGTAVRRHGGRAVGRYDGTNVQDLARTYSHPEWLVGRWLRRFGPGDTEALLAHDNRPPAIALRPLRWTLEELETSLRASRITAQRAADGEGCDARGVRVEDLPGYAEGAFIVQDPAQRRVLAFSSVPAGARVWDACAAPGGKTAVLARTARVTASDWRARRLGALRETLRRTGSAVPVVAADARRPPFGAAFDVVLVDAPCSATGTLAKHPDARWRLGPEQIGRLARLQATILDGVAETVPREGRLVYITCSLEPEENEDQVETFVARHPAFERETNDLRIFPPADGTDGGFAARLVRAR